MMGPGKLVEKLSGNGEGQERHRSENGGMMTRRTI